MTSAHANIAYRIPSVLRDLVLVDMLELTGTTVAAAQVLNLSQPSVSRRFRQLAAELGLQPNRRDKPGRRFCDADWMRLLRQGVNPHRLDCGVLRLGGPAAAEKWIGRSVWAEWIPQPVAAQRLLKLVQTRLTRGQSSTQDNPAKLQLIDYHPSSLASHSQETHSSNSIKAET